MEIEFQVRITPEEKRQELISAALMGCGVLLTALLLSFFVRPLGFLGILALPCFLTYFKTAAQEKLPDRLALEDNNLIFCSRGKKVVSIPLTAISGVGYKEGIIVHLKKPLQERILLLEPQLLSKKKRGDFYFEWFEPKAFLLIQSRVESSLNNVMHTN